MEQHNHYFLFAGEYYYPSGGVEDFVGRFDTLTEALKSAADAKSNRSIGWWHIAVLTPGGDFVIVDKGGYD